MAIYPEEGTFWSDHPVAVVQRDWVTKDKQKAADDYIAFLLKEEQQKKALDFGFRPAVDGVALDQPIDADHGADPSKPGPGGLLRPPSAAVMQAALDSWKQHKKHARVIIVFDDSGSMAWEKGKLESAKEGAKEIVKGLAPDQNHPDKKDNSVGLLVFDSFLDLSNTKPQKLTDERVK